jgi:aminoglycoside 6'-N-acetyltransferase I
LLYREASIADIEAITDILCELDQMEWSELRAENEILLRDERQGFFLAFAKGFNPNKPIAVAHVALRSEYVNGAKNELAGGCGYLEAVYVKPEYRWHGVAAELARLGEEWVRERGLKEFASDCLLQNTDSYLFHLRLGFSETERCIFFRKEL